MPFTITVESVELPRIDSIDARQHKKYMTTLSETRRAQSANSGGVWP
jgi:hypothetical protein